MMENNNMEPKEELVRHPEFTVHMLNGVGKIRAAEIRIAFDILLQKLEKICTPGRELSITKTKLEEACFFAKKAMAINSSNQESK